MKEPRRRNTGLTPHALTGVRVHGHRLNDSIAESSAVSCESYGRV